MPIFFNACCGRDTDVVANREAPAHASPHNSQVNAVVNAPGRGAIHQPLTGTAGRANTLRRRAEIERDLVSWRTKGTAAEHRNEAVRRISQCVQNNAKSLCLSHLQLTSLPQSIGQLAQLETLMVDHNALGDLPNTASDLRNLQHLCVDHNQLTRLPTDLGNMTKLRTLHANDNQLTELPQSLSALSKLLDLQVQNNQLQVFPAQLETLRIGTIV